MSQHTVPDQKSDRPPPQLVHHEARNAENSAAYLLPKLRSMKESNPQLTLLDVGAGSGSITAALAEIIPDGHVTGVDVNPNILPRARAVAEMAGLKNIDFQQADAYKLPFADATFDITCCHQMLIHIPNPWDALSEMIRVTKPGGVVAAREGDFETECVWPDLPILSKFHKLVAGTISNGGGTPTAGRQLLSWALKCGMERSQVTLSYSSWVYQTLSERQTWTQGLINMIRNGSLRERGLRMGLATEDELEKMAQGWEEWAAKDDASLAMLHGEILIQK